MDVMKTIKERRSIRNYKDKDVTRSQIKKLLDAARWAPSASNNQPWEFIVIRDKQIKAEIARIKGQQFIAETPVVIAFVTSPRTSHFHKVDGSLATQNFQLAAWEMGLGTCWIGTFDRKKVKQLLNVPEEKHLLTVMPLGYPAEEGHSTRKPLQKSIYWNKYGKT
ncbi:MAG: nitroreductase [Candidatus Korarchaeota archaeon]|nr:nitroreductase [Candidatus Korarchaeota archaeon]NIU83431.1 nitroreductase [Candidatus Thorarchaeota archaeon]NIW13703.1 nitroreductase [Candidatus Thorarchaeota archaeon]NIW51802.1 nitroreductase [Candidatus Korarchaeota archaeon]